MARSIGLSESLRHREKAVSKRFLEQAIARLAHDGPEAFLPGHVWLAGAGPGDPGLPDARRAFGARTGRCAGARRAGVGEAVAGGRGARPRCFSSAKRGGRLIDPAGRASTRGWCGWRSEAARCVRLKGGHPAGLRARRRGGAGAGAAEGIPFRVLLGRDLGLRRAGSASTFRRQCAASTAR